MVRFKVSNVTVGAMSPSDDDRGTTQAGLKESEADDNKEKTLEDIQFSFRQTKSS